MSAARWRHLLARARRPALLGTARRVHPLSHKWGYDRGTPVDRYYIERFLDEHRGDVRGRVLEVKDRSYTDRYGTGVVQADVLDVDASNPLATVIGDLAGDDLPRDAFDCFVLTQTLQLVYDLRAAVAGAHRLLRPGGVLLVTVPSVSRSMRDVGPVRDYWRFTPAACERLFGEAFGHDAVTVRGHGNVLTSIGFLLGMAHEELSARELDAVDALFPTLVTVRAVKR